MNIDTIYDGKILVKFIYSPLNEMLCALHVLCNSKHHLHRKEWADSVYEKIDNKLKNSILEFGEITDDYMIPMDFNMYFKECDDLNILSSIEYLENVNLYNIRKIFRKYNISINSGQYKRFLSFLKQFYIEVYMKEEKYIEPVIIRTLKKKADYTRENGIYKLVDSIHERINVDGEKVTFLKYKEITYAWEEIKFIYISVSTFISPHLLLGTGKDYINLTVLLELQSYENEAPEDLVRMLSSLGDSTRLRILKEISYKGRSTQELSKILSMSEAAVSKALKLLFESKIVSKQRNGNYIIYNLNKRELDYLEYKIYEYILR